MTTVGTRDIVLHPVQGQSAGRQDILPPLDNKKVAQDVEALSLVVCISGWEIAPGYKLNDALLMQLRFTPSGVFAVTYLDAEEYGWGTTSEEAVSDLLSSLVEYLASLEERQERLAQSGREDLDKLRRLIAREGNR